MINLVNTLFVALIYQPFFNLLVYIYLVLDKLLDGQADMGIALIVFTFVFRIILLPLSLNSDRSEREKIEIKARLAEVEKLFRHDPVKKREASRKVVSANKKLLISEAFDIGIQVAVVLMLFRIFKTGLEGADFDLLYSFMPKIKEPFNLVFLGRFDLSQTSVELNIVSSLVIFLAEFLSLRFSPWPVSSEDKLMLVVLPLGAFTYFAFMPAGKKLFVIATLTFSISLILLKQAILVYHTFRNRLSGGKKAAWKS